MKEQNKEAELNKVPKSINIQKTLKEVLKSHEIKGLTQSFNAFYSYFEPIIDYIYSVFSEKNEFTNTSINITEERLYKLNKFIENKIFGNFSEIIRFIYLLGICELHRYGNGNKNNFDINNLYRMCLDCNNEKLKESLKEENKPSKEMQEILSRVISIEEYREKINDRK